MGVTVANVTDGKIFLNRLAWAESAAAARQAYPLRIQIVTDRDMPPGYFEMRSGRQRLVYFADGSNHDPGDEDRSER